MFWEKERQPNWPWRPGGGGPWLGSPGELARLRGNETEGGERGISILTPPG
jgi:hypothetical protein